MLKKAAILSLALGLGVALAPMVSSADINQPVLKAQTSLADDMNMDSANSNNDDDSSMSADSDDNSTTTNEDDTDSDDTLSSDATE